MPTPTYTPLQTITLSGSASSVIFGSIPSSYKDLVLVIQGSVTSNTNIFVRFNSDSTAGNYSYVYMLGAGSGSGSSGATSGNGWGVLLSGALSTNIYQIQDYSATDKHKSALLRTSQGNSGDVIAYAGRWANTNAINSIGLYPSGSFTFNSGSTFSLYGIAG